jgi:hypothetical protein
MSGVVVVTIHQTSILIHPLFFYCSTKRAVADNYLQKVKVRTTINRLYTETFDSIATKIFFSLIIVLNTICQCLNSYGVGR